MMKIIIITVAICLILISGIIYFKPEYESAFEADQQCHFEIGQLSTDNSAFGCDHDLETRQWILFESAKSGEPAEVLRRYRY